MKYDLNASFVHSLGILKYFIQNDKLFFWKIHNLLSISDWREVGMTQDTQMDVSCSGFKVHIINLI